MHLIRDFCPTSQQGFLAANGGQFYPGQISAIGGWLRLQASSQSGGEWTNWVDVLTGNNGAINAARRPAVAAAANGLPVADFNDTDDCVAWPMAASNNSTTTKGWAFWAAPDAVAGTQMLISSNPGTGASSGLNMLSYFSGTRVHVDCYINAGGDGRQLETPNGAGVAGTFRFYTLEYDSSVGGDNCLTITVDTVVQTFALAINIGAGGSLGVLPTVTGNHLIANLNNGTGSSPFNGRLGPNIFALNSKMTGATTGLLTTAARAALFGFEAPT